MTATEKLHERGQSIWLDNITREMLDSGQLQAYIDEYSVTGLTSNPSIFDKAIAAGGYDDAIREKGASGTEPEALFFELAIEDLRRAADAFLPIHERTAGLDGWVSLEVSPLLAYDPNTTVEVAKELHNQAARPNLLIKIPGTKEGLLAIEEAIAAGIPVNVTLLFSADQYVAAAAAFMQGVERRIEAQRNPVVGSVASVFMSRWDVAVQDQAPPAPGGPARPCGRAPGLPRLPRADGLRALAAPGERRRPHAAAPVGEHEHERPEGAGRPVPAVPGSALHGEHGPRGDAPGLLRPRPCRRADAR
jgi:transaldolase